MGGCNGAPVVRADSDRTFRKSVEDISRRATGEKMARFDAALRALVLSRAISSDAERHSHFVSFTDSAAGSRAFTSPLQDWEARRAAIVVARIGRLIDGRTIDDVIDLAAREQAALDARMKEWSARQSNAPEVTWTMPESRALRLDPADRAALDRVQVSGVSITNMRTGDGDRIVLSFLVENLSDRSVRAISLTNSANAQAREIDPDDVFHFAMPTPLPPGARRRIMTSAGVPAGLSRDIRIVGLEDNAGQRSGVAMAPKATAAPLPPHYVAVTQTPLMDLRTMAGSK
ncbi:MAG: hypothetical protein K2Y29_15950 [Beijerinckiaceae bacterium]|nr:hypothetical protein [Beijerinckiaceae bacterium]